MQGTDIIKNIKPKWKPYERTVFILRMYKDLKEGKEIIDVKRDVIDILNEVFEYLNNDDYYMIIELYYIKGYTIRKTIEEANIDRATFYRQRRRLTKRISVILYGDEALL